MNDADLELYSLDELIEEVMRRMDHGVFSGLRVTVEGDDGTSDNEAVHFWKGNSLTCSGLIAEANMRILRKRAEESEALGN